MTPRETIRRMIVGSPMEGAAKLLHYRLTGAKSSLYDFQTIRIMRRVLTPTSNAIDIGCFEGSMLRHMLRFAPQGRHMALEPIPWLYERLKKRFPNVETLPYALWDTPGDRTFYEVNDHPALSGLSRRGFGPSSTAEHVVRTETLDRLVPNDRSVDFIKVDVEGAEYEVFRGATKTLRRCRPTVVFECGVGGVDFFGTSPREIHKLLTSVGLRVFLLSAWLKRESALEETAFSREFEEGRNYYFVAAP